MKWLSVCVLCVVIVGEFKCDAIPKSHFGHGLQIGSANDTSFTLHLANLSKLERMLSDEDVKDREVAVISIAGTVNLGKSFLMNFFIRFLEAKCDQRNVSNWERKNECINGFDWGLIRTKGISVWPHIFKRTLPNGTKVAIILLDTQGLHSAEYHQSKNKDARIYAFSAMASSVQCYNVQRYLSSKDLDELDTFSGYGSMANEIRNSTDSKYFHNLTLIVRDKPYEGEHFEFGRQKDDVKHKFLGFSPTDTIDKEEQSKRMYNTYYENIDLFYMPTPSDAVTQTYEFDGNLTNVNPKFIAHVHHLAESLFAPQNLVVKKVAGDAIKAKEFLTYLIRFGEMLNSDKLPKLYSYAQTMFNIKYELWQKESLESYKTSMENTVKKCNPTNNVSYFFDNELLTIHNQSKCDAMKMFSARKKFNEDDYVREYSTALDKSIEKEFSTFNETNANNKLCFGSNVERYYENLMKNISGKFKERILNEVRSAESFIEEKDFSEMETNYIKNASNEFMARDKYANNPKYKKDLAPNYMDKLKDKMVEILTEAKDINIYKKTISEYENVAIRSNVATTSVFVVIAFVQIGNHIFNA
ncbi:atlastin-like [Sitodiplosis mosellana]|uniref:atlastin-like n=1 Tax=Sitodiplosis mosellana TaxID=263140 RepID=UPI002444241D|nr:atlastin-like [Sitodiplosis mosellana]